MLAAAVDDAARERLRLLAGRVAPALSDGSVIGLRAMTGDDLERKVAWANDPAVNRQIGFLERVELAGTRTWFHGQVEDPEVALLTLTRDDEAIGYVKLGAPLRGDTADYLGLAIGETRYWGRGYGTKAVALLLEHLFAGPRWRALTGEWPTWNTRSIALHRKLGFTFAGEAPPRRHPDGTIHAVDRMTITRDVYEARRAG
ncbi:MAG: GNAT family N-acetyltransferase [Myxococcales bacterium]|nr:GNAT family N-acetyltransferase [Myxococcales bacterium]